jgi:hypothetical protein
MKYVAYDQTQADGDLAFDMDEGTAVFYPATSEGRLDWHTTTIFAGSESAVGGILTDRITVDASATGLNSSYQFYVNGDSYFDDNVQIDSLGIGTSASGTTGEIRATNNITAYYSDERLKDFKGKIDNALDKVSQLNGYYFTENAKAKELGYNNDSLQVGVSAQEVEKVLPEIVTKAPIDSKYKTVWYDKLVPLLIEAVKEQQQQINELKARLDNDPSK